MTKLAGNPIPFNPLSRMTAHQLGEVAEAMRTIFTVIERDPESAEQIIYGHIEQVRDQWLRKWGATL